MKNFLLLIILFSLSLNAQEKKCYSITIENTGLKDSDIIWKSIKVKAPQEKLIKFLRDGEWKHACNYILNSPQNILDKSEEIPCIDDAIHIEFREPTEFVEFYKESKKNDSSVVSEICINSNGEVSFSLSNEFGSIQVNSKGNFTLSANGPNGLKREVKF